ncbi:glycosyltransferase [Paenibacillus sp. strain BS8-2]
MKQVLIASYDMEVGGVERSLAGMLDEFDYDNHRVDVMLYRHKGDFMGLLSQKANLLQELPAYATFRSSIKETILSGHLGLGLARLLSKFHTAMLTLMRRKLTEPGYLQMQLMWKYALPFLPKEGRRYDAAISYLWPHYYVAEKVNATRKLAWIHTDFSTIETDIEMDLKIWRKYDAIIAVSEGCKSSFVSKYGELAPKVHVVENVISQQAVTALAMEQGAANEMKADDRFKLLTVARLSHAKGIDQAVKAMKRLKDRGFNNIVWYVVGYGGDEAQIKELIRFNQLEDSFVLLGKQLNPYPYMAACDLYVQPSRYEGKAVTVTEAQVLCKAVLITNYPTASSQVRHEQDGYIVHMSENGIADGIEHLYNHPELLKKFEDACRVTNYGGVEELSKLYALMIDAKENAVV